MNDPATRLRELREDTMRKAAWTLALSRFQDSHGREPSNEEARELAEAAGVHHPAGERRPPDDLLPGAADAQDRERTTPERTE